MIRSRSSRDPVAVFTVLAPAPRFACTAELIDVIDREDGGDEALSAFRDRIATNG